MQTRNKGVYPIDPEFVYSLNEEFLSFTGFIIDSRFYHKNNLKIAYLLIHCTQMNVSQAAAEIGRSRSIVYENILFNNPCFVTEDLRFKKILTKGKWGGIRQAKMISLSNNAIKHIDLINELAIKRLGDHECHKLTGRAEKIKGKYKILNELNPEKQEIYKIHLLDLKRKRNHPDFSRWVEATAEVNGKTVEQLLTEISKVRR